MEQWVAQRRLGLSDSSPEVNKAAERSAEKERITLAELSSLYRREEEEEERRKEEELRLRKKMNRLSCKYNCSCLHTGNTPPPPPPADGAWGRGGGRRKNDK